MTDFNTILNESLRLAVLRLLTEAPAYSANSSVLHQGAGLLGFHVSRDQVNTQLDWLKEQDLVHVEDIGQVRVVTIKQRGQEVATGIIKATGVARPSAR